MIDIVDMQKDEKAIEFARSLGITLASFQKGYAYKVDDKPKNDAQFIVTDSLNFKTPYAGVRHQFFYKKKSYHHPGVESQVKFKEVKAKDWIVILDVSHLKEKLAIDRTKLICRICRKYKIPMAIATFAKHPYELRSPDDLKALGTLCGMDTQQQKQAILVIERLLKEKHL